MESVDKIKDDDIEKPAGQFFVWSSPEKGVQQTDRLTVTLLIKMYVNIKLESKISFFLLTSLKDDRQQIHGAECCAFLP